MQGREDEIAYRVIDYSEDQNTFYQYGVQATPTVIVLDPTGDIVAFFVGTPREGELKAAIEQAVM